MADETEIDKLAHQLGVTWPHLAEARAKSELIKEELRQRLEGLDSADLSILAFGSVGRDDKPDKCAAAARAVLSSYDEFIGMLADRETREHLEELPPDAVDGDDIFQRARELSQTYRDGLLDIFFETKLAALTRFYGVFC